MDEMTAFESLKRPIEGVDRTKVAEILLSLAETGLTESDIKGMASSIHTDSCHKCERSWLASQSAPANITYFPRWNSGTRYGRGRRLELGPIESKLKAWGQINGQRRCGECLMRSVEEILPDFKELDHAELRKFLTALSLTISQTDSRFDHSVYYRFYVRLVNGLLGLVPARQKRLVAMITKVMHQLHMV